MRDASCCFPGRPLELIQCRCMAPLHARSSPTMMLKHWIIRPDSSLLSADMIMDLSVAELIIRPVLLHIKVASISIKPNGGCGYHHPVIVYNDLMPVTLHR